MSLLGVVPCPFACCFFWSPSLALAADCGKWNTKEFFQTANVEDVKTCLSQGADPKARDKDGVTPLHVAAANNKNPAVITALLDAGADLKARTKKGETPWDLAKYREDLQDSDAYWRLHDGQF